MEEIRTNRLLKKEAKEEDVSFYLDQQTTRLAHMSDHDKIFEEKAAGESFLEERMLSSVTAAAAEVG